MENKKLKYFLRKEVTNYLISSRKKSGVSIKAAARQLGYASETKLLIYEKDGNIPSSELVKITEIYQIPRAEFSLFMLDLQLKAYEITRH